jgi:TPR repeat protein
MLRRAGFVAAFGCVLATSFAAGPRGDWSAVIAAWDRGDHETAVLLLRSLAESGDADAQFDLAVLFQVGEDVPQDYVQAYKWYTVAAPRFAPNEQSMRERSLKNRDRIAALMTPAQLAEAKRLATAWKPAPVGAETSPNR